MRKRKERGGSGIGRAADADEDPYPTVPLVALPRLSVRPPQISALFFPRTLLAEDILEDWVCELGVDGVSLELEIPLKFAGPVTSYWVSISLAPSSFAPGTFAPIEGAPNLSIV